jgi:hypothetical protein
MASMMHTVWPFFTRSPSFTNGGSPGAGLLMGFDKAEGDRVRAGGRGSTGLLCCCGHQQSRPPWVAVTSWLQHLDIQPSKHTLFYSVRQNANSSSNQRGSTHAHLYMVPDMGLAISTPSTLGGAAALGAGGGAAAAAAGAGAAAGAAIGAAAMGAAWTICSRTQHGTAQQWM